MNATQVLEALRALRHAPRDGAYWPRLATCLTHLCRARRAWVLQAGEAGAWLALGQHPQEAEAQPPAWLGAALAGLVPKALAQGHAHEPRPDGDLTAAVSLLGTPVPTVLVLDLSARERSSINELLLRAQLVADVPDSPPHLPPPDAQAADALAPGWVTLLDWMAQVMQAAHFGEASLRLVNTLAAILPCDQVVLGACHDGQARVLAISHVERFEHHAGHVQWLEAALDEAADQHVDIVFPPPPEANWVVLAHDRLSRQAGYAHLASLVMSGPVDGPAGAGASFVLLLGRRETGFDPAQLHLLSVTLHLLQPWLEMQRERSQNWAVRWASLARQRLRQWFSPQAPGRKVAVLAAVLACAIVTLGTWPYRIEASAELSTDSIQTLSAPFDGYLGKVQANLGEQVAAGAVLAELDTRELSLQATDLQSELRRYEAEADRDRARNQVADTQIAQARMAQTQARLERVQFQLQQARLTAPFAGVVVEGERKELAGAPVHQGDKIFRLARVEGLYAVLHVSEREMRALPERATGRLLLLSQPDQAIAFHVESMVAVAQVKGQQAGQFELKVKLDAPAATWWRPGMSALALIDAGDRPIIWIWTHKLLDSLRMTLWW